jgi:hypothetical protein
MGQSVAAGFKPGERVYYSFARGIRDVGSRQEIACEVVDGEPFRGERDQPWEPLRLRVRCVQRGDPMNDMEFVPFVARLRRV